MHLIIQNLEVKIYVV